MDKMLYFAGLSTDLPDNPLRKIDIATIFCEVQRQLERSNYENLHDVVDDG